MGLGHAPLQGLLQLWLLALGNDQRRALTNFNQHLGQYRVGKSRMVAWRGPDGKELET